MLNSLGAYTHPHPDPAHVMVTYRTYILSFKFKQNEQRKVYAKRVAREVVAKRHRSVCDDDDSMLTYSACSPHCLLELSKRVAAGERIEVSNPL